MIFVKYLFLKFLVIFLLLHSICFSSDINKLKTESSLTQKYIDSLRQGKWGITDPDWVNVKVA